MQSRDGNLGCDLQKPSEEELCQKQEWFNCNWEAGGGVDAGAVN